MIRFVKRLHRSFKRLRHAREARPRLETLRPTLEKVCGGPVRFAPTDGGGHDYVFYVGQDGRRIAVLRIANDRYVPCSWEEAFAAIGRELRAIDPEQAVFYASGRGSLPAKSTVQPLTGSKLSRESGWHSTLSSARGRTFRTAMRQGASGTSTGI